jgi:hypothetical protein
VERGILIPGNTAVKALAAFGDKKLNVFSRYESAEAFESKIT